MQKRIHFYKGQDISQEQIKAIQNIAYQRYPKEIFDKYYKNIQNITDLAKNHHTKVQNEQLILGRDWMILYKIEKKKLTFLEWIAINKQENNIRQSIEMYKEMKRVLIENFNKQMIASMRHDTTYQLYLKLIEKGLLLEKEHNFYIDSSIPKDIYINQLKKIKEETFSSKEIEKYSSYYPFFLHYVEFYLTNNITSISQKKKS